MTFFYDFPKQFDSSNSEARLLRIIGELYHLLKILYEYFKFSESVKFFTLCVKAVWVDSLLIPKK